MDCSALTHSMLIRLDGGLIILYYNNIIRMECTIMGVEY